MHHMFNSFAHAQIIVSRRGCFRDLYSFCVGGAGHETTRNDLKMAEPDDKFVKDLPDDYQCMICAKVLNEPHLTDCCGQHFCQACLEQWFKKQAKKICPHCRSEIFAHMRYIPLKRKIDDLEVYCPNQNEGCKEIMKLGTLGDHKNKCGFAKVTCTQGCGKFIFRKELNQHYNNECSKRRIKCKYCGKVDHYEVISGEHTTTCREYPVKCPRGCTQSGEIKRKDINKHTEICPLEKVQCPFSEAGCDTSILRKDLSTHIEANGQQHLMKMMTAYNKLKEDFKRMSSLVAIEPVKLTTENKSFSFIITSSKGWISPPFCVPGGYKFCIKHKEGKIAGLMLFKEKHGELSMDTRYTYRLEIFYTKKSPSIRQLPEQNLILNFDFRTLEQIVVDGYEKEVACITMPEGDLLSASIIVILVHTMKSALEIIASWLGNAT